MNEIKKIKAQIRSLLLFFMAALIFSGITAVPLEPELRLALAILPSHTALYVLLVNVLNAVRQTQNNFPFVFYGFDWLAFAHIIIAMVFVGPYREPVRNIWVIRFGMIACVCVIPFALVVGGLRGLPIWWRLIDCLFGLIGIIPLWLCYSKIQRLEILTTAERLNTVF